MSGKRKFSYSNEDLIRIFGYKNIRTLKQLEDKGKFRREDLASVFCYLCEKNSRDVEIRSDGSIRIGKYRRNNLEADQKNHWCRRAYHNALTAGIIERGDTCEACGVTGSVMDGHHTDYNEPLKVVWMCHECHMKLHGIFN